ncbi:MAG: hypothetical protein IKR28_04305, partial [Selenomonadaceae bacterium]|nr:hypothetical protein [Selenomonadaceae bacterium]
TTANSPRAFHFSPELQYPLNKYQKPLKTDIFTIAPSLFHGLKYIAGISIALGKLFRKTKNTMYFYVFLYTLVKMLALFLRPAYNVLTSRMI